MEDMCAYVPVPLVNTADEGVCKKREPLIVIYFTLLYTHLSLSTMFNSAPRPTLIFNSAPSPTPMFNSATPSRPTPKFNSAPCPTPMFNSALCSFLL